MAIIDERFGSDSAEDDGAGGPRSDCPHLMLVPRWESAADTGNDDLASRFECGLCGIEFSREEATSLLEEG